MAFLSLLLYFFVECKPTVREVSRELEDYKDKCNLSIIQFVHAIIMREKNKNAQAENFHICRITEC